MAKGDDVESAQTQEGDGPSRRRNVLNILTWIFIASLFILTGIWMIWASKQPRIHSIFTSDE